MAIQSFQNLGKEMSQQLHLANIFLSCSFFPGKQSIDFFFFFYNLNGSIIPLYRHFFFGSSFSPVSHHGKKKIKLKYNVRDCKPPGHPRLSSL